MASKASKASAKNKTDNEPVDMSLLENSPALEAAVVTAAASPLPASGTGSSNQEFRSFEEPQPQDEDQLPEQTTAGNPNQGLNTAFDPSLWAANTPAPPLHVASTPQLSQNPLIGEEAARAAADAIAAAELGLAGLSLSDGGHPPPRKPQGTAASIVSNPVGGGRALRSRTRNLGEEDKENLLHTNDSVPGVTAYQVKTVTSVLSGRKITTYLNIIPDEKNQKEYISKTIFLKRFGFNPETGELRDMRMVNHLLEAAPSWTEVIMPQTITRQDNHGDTVQHPVQNKDGLENVASGNAGTRSTTSCRGAEDDKTDVQTHHMSVSEVDHLDNTLKQLEGKRPRRHSTLQQQGHSVDTLIRHVIRWATWCQNARELLQQDSFQGGESVENMVHLHSIYEVYTDYLDRLLNLDLYLLDEAEILKNVPGPRHQEDDYVRDFWDSGFKEQAKIARSIRHLEVFADKTWRFYVLATWFIKTQLRLMKREADFYLNPAEVCKLIPILRLQRTKVHLERARVFKEWDIVFKGVEKVKSISLSNANNLITDILEQRDKSLAEQVGKYLSRLESHILPYIRLQLNSVDGLTQGPTHLEARQRFNDLATVVSSSFRVPMRTFSKGQSVYDPLGSQNQAGHNDELLRLINERPDPHMNQPPKQTPTNKLTANKCETPLLPSHMDSQQVAETQALLQRNTLSRQQSKGRASGWREGGLTSLINQFSSAPPRRSIVPGQEQPAPPREAKPPVSALATGGPLPRSRHLGNHPEERNMVYPGAQKPEGSGGIPDPWQFENFTNDRSPANDPNRENYRDSGPVHQGLQDHRGGKPSNFQYPYQTFSVGGSSSHGPKSVYRQGGDGRHPGRGRGDPPPPGGGGFGPPGGEPDPGGGSGDGFQNPRRNQDNLQGNFTMQDLGRALHQEQADPDILDGFTSHEDQRGFYDSLPEPWNVQPRTKGKKEHIYRNVTAVFDDKSKTFKGNVNDGTYYTWRVDVIQCIHKAALPISDKILLLNRVVDRTHPVLQMLFTYNTFSPDTYKMLIETLEHDFGGDLRIYTYFRNQLLKGKKLDFDKREAKVSRS